MFKLCPHPSQPKSEGAHTIPENVRIFMYQAASESSTGKKDREERNLAQKTEPEVFSQCVQSRVVNLPAQGKRRWPRTPLRTGRCVLLTARTCNRRSEITVRYHKCASIRRFTPPPCPEQLEQGVPPRLHSRTRCFLLRGQPSHLATPPRPLSSPPINRKKSRKELHLAQS